ncbi:MAG: ABC transporter [Haloarculaceae archaeon]
MFRAVLAVALATVLLAATLPALDDARVERSNALLSDELDRLVTFARTLRARETAIRAGEGARWRVTLRLPSKTWSSAGLTSLTVGDTAGHPSTSNGTVVAWRVDGGRRRRRRVTEVPLVARGRNGRDRLRFRSGGRHRLVLLLVRRDGTPTVLVRRPEV